MFTDMVGYTALTQADERQALAVLDRHHRLLRPVFPRHRGREIKTMGDSFLVEFDSALEAVECALEVQRLLQEYNDSSTDGWKIRLRIGIHLGDVEHVDGDVLGDAVNIASRLEPLAEPGGICISEPVFGQVRNKIDVGFEKLEPRELKNVQFPVDVYKVTPRKPALAEKPVIHLSREHRLAVLPFANLSPDPQDEYFADGLTEELITELSRVPGLQVIARTSTMRFKGAPVGVKDVGRELDVDLALEGSVRKAANRIRITAQLIETGTEGHLWADRFDRDLTDIFAVQSEISRHVANQLGVSLGSGAWGSRPPSGKLDAYFHYLKGRTLWSHRTEEGLAQALKHFEAAVAIDPKFAQAYSGIADCYLVMTWNSEIFPWSEVASRTKEAARKAIELDEGLAEAHASLGLALEADYSWTGAEAELRSAIALNPNYSPAHNWLALLFLELGRPDEAEAELLLASRSDPLSPSILLNRASRLAARGGLDAADQLWSTIIELEPEYRPVVLLHKVGYFVAAGRLEEAKQAYRSIASSWSEAGANLEERYTWGPAVVRATLGDREAAERSLDRLSQIAKRVFVPARGFANIYAALGDADRFFEWIDRAVADHSAELGLLRTFPLYAPYRSDPRFAEIFRRCGTSLSRSPGVAGFSDPR
jgi:adenylate cyclase